MRGSSNFSGPIERIVFGAAEYNRHATHIENSIQNATADEINAFMALFAAAIV